jgi:hypothetical protein
MNELEKAAREVIRCRTRDGRTKSPMVIPSDFHNALDHLEKALPDPRDRVVEAARAIRRVGRWACNGSEGIVITVSGDAWHELLDALLASDE